jgi:hypothetical protein
MENNNQTTTTKLEDVINTLLDSYQDLKEESQKKDETIKSLEKKVKTLETDIENIEGDNDSIIGKIETMLNDNTIKENTTKRDTEHMIYDEKKLDVFNSVDIDDIIDNHEKKETAFDEDRMNKLLGGI